MHEMTESISLEAVEVVSPQLQHLEFRVVLECRGYGYERVVL